MEEDSTKNISSVRAGIAGYCPACGKGKLFQGYLKVAGRCSVCDLDLSEYENADGPAVFAILLLGFLVVGLALFVEVRYQPPFWLHALLWVPFILLSVYLLLPRLKGWLIGASYKYRSRHRGEGP